MLRSALSQLNRPPVSASLLTNHHLAAMTQFSSTASTSQVRPRYKAVVFDLGGVFMPSPIQAIRDVEKHYKLEPLSFGKKIAFSKEFADLETGKLDLEEFAVAGKNLFKGMIPPEDVREVIFKIFGAVVFEDRHYTVVSDAAKALRADGLKTALLTNNWMISRNFLEHPLPVNRKMFDQVIESCRVGVRKPDPEIFEFTLKQLQVKPEETIFVDDLGHNLKAARSLGIQTVKAENPRQIVDDLERILNLSLRRFVPGTVSPAKHLLLPMDKLQSFLDTIPGVQHIDEAPCIRQFVNGRSNPTYFIGYGKSDLVLRRKPPGKLLPSAHAIDREYALFSALANSNVPVPKMRVYCKDTNVIGSEFFVMDYVKGFVYKDMKLPGVVPADRRRHLYTEMNKTLAAIHAVDLDKVGLEKWGKRDASYLERNLSRWVQQYESSKTVDHESMTKLIAWLKTNIPKDPNPRITLIHGDYRLDNLIFDKNTGKAISVLDWELSTVGDPLTDLATSIFHYYIPSALPFFSGISDIDPTSIGLPTLREQITEYFRMAKMQPPNGQDPVEFMKYYVGFCAFRYAAIAQGVYKRAVSGQSSSPGSERFGEAVPFLAQLALKIVGEGKSPPKTSTSSTGGSSGGVPLGPGDMRPEAKKIYEKLTSFIAQKITPLEKDLLRFYNDVATSSNDQQRWTTVHPKLEELKAEAKKQGLWNLWLCKDLDPQNKYGGAGLTNVEYAFMAELMGKYQPFGPEVFNCAAPDTGNMEVLIKYGNEEQRSRWLYKLLSGEIRSAFAMTEPAVASSDATNISASIRRDGSDFVLNGRKWWTSGIMNPKCEVIIYLGKSDALSSNPIHKQHSMVLVPRNAPGVKVIRPLSVFGYFDEVHGGHGEVLFENVRVNAKEALLQEEGKGFAMGQGRLGPGRIHHCMRLIGMSQRSIELAIERANSRIAFGRPLSMRDSIQMELAKSYAELEQARLLVLKTAHMIDTVGARAASKEIAMIKAIVPGMSQRIIDRAIQIHGGGGLSQDFPLGGFMAAARALRLADGPDEVHWRTIARLVYKQHVSESGQNPAKI